MYILLREPDRLPVLAKRLATQDEAIKKQGIRTTPTADNTLIP